ncbi:phosphotransferase [Janibacter melonis]|uniref:phosphotransferase enzyme family protein n=1 Tax=Janibacter melonis TaxID=262209 RepID=UPI0020447262|nr:phosphotransferase [Janibacter melonis]MCM3554671.1 phosphotransferase [Janibacter melonis]
MSADGTGLPADVALREAAERALPLLGIEAERLGPVAPGAPTFAVDLVGGGRLALRLRPVVDADEGRVHGRAAWAQALAMAGVDVATPWTGPAGEEQVLLPGLAPDEQLRASATWWCEGEGVTDLDADRARALGATAARMHEQASGWAAPEGAFVELLDPLAGYPELLTGALGDPRDVAVVETSLELAQTALSRAREHEVHVVHGDLRPDALLWQSGRDRPWVVDLDDAVLAPAAHDLAVATFALRRSPDDDAPTALLAGYASVRPLPPLDDATFEGLLAGRQLHLTSSLLASSTSALRPEVEAYLAATLVRLRTFLDDGVLDPRLTAQG